MRPTFDSSNCFELLCEHVCAGLAMVLAGPSENWNYRAWLRTWKSPAWGHSNLIHEEGPTPTPTSNGLQPSCRGEGRGSLSVWRVPWWCAHWMNSPVARTGVSTYRDPPQTWTKALLGGKAECYAVEGSCSGHSSGNWLCVCLCVRVYTCVVGEGGQREREGDGMITLLENVKNIFIFT